MEIKVTEFTCTTSTARPAASVYWYIHSNGNSSDRTQITENITTTTDYDDLSITTSILRFVATRLHNIKQIYCRANNSVNTSQVRPDIKILLNVLYPANVTSFTVEGFTNQSVTVNVHQTVSFICVADSNTTAITSLSYPRVASVIETNVTSEENNTITIVFNVIAYPPPTFTSWQLVNES
ncbi:hypothetical protein ACF0H5_019393 [Mactra antiquata]